MAELLDHDHDKPESTFAAYVPPGDTTTELRPPPAIRFPSENQMASIHILNLT